MSSAHTKTAVDMYRSGSPVAEITTTTGLAEHEIAAAVTLAEQPAAPTQEVVVRPSTPASDSIEALLAWAERHDAKGVRGLAGRARDAIGQLRTRKAGDAALTEAEREVQRLEKQLADAKAALRKARAGKPAVPATEYTGPWPADPTPQQLRAWAKTVGMPCNSHGSVTRQVADAYHQARTAATA